jgi:hypothetical protein
LKLEKESSGVEIEDIKVRDVIRIDLNIYLHIRKQILLTGRKFYIKRCLERVYKIKKILKPMCLKDCTNIKLLG